MTQEETAMAADVAAERGSAAWAEAVRLQRWSTTPDHHEFYALGCEMVTTVRELADMVTTLRAQVPAYGRRVKLRDDTRGIDPMDRLAQATDELAALTDALTLAERYANNYWSAIGHVAIED